MNDQISTKLLTGLSIAFFGLLASGCETVSNYNFSNNGIVLACPVEQVLKDANKLTRFQQGGGKDLVDIDYEADLKSVQLTCTTDVDKESRIGTMTVEVVNTFVVKRGPANQQKRAQVPYFVSVTDQNRNILYKEKFALDANFGGNKSQLTLRNTPIILDLPLNPKLIGQSYRIYSGLELTKEQLHYNRQK